MKSIIYGFLLSVVSAGIAHADLLLEDFEQSHKWIAEGNTKGVGLGHSDNAAEGQGALLVTDKATEDHFCWLTKSCPKGVWDWSNHRNLNLWLRGSGEKSQQMYAKVVDEQGRQMFWRIGSLKGTEWQRFTVDICREPSVFRHESANLARIVKVGIRCNPGHGYTFAVDRVELTEPLAAPVQTGVHTEYILDKPISHLSSRSTDQVEDSMIGANLQMGRLTTGHIDRLAATGVKWAARMPLSIDSPHAEKIRAELLRHKFRLLAHLYIDHMPTEDELAGRLERLKKTVATLSGDIRVWEIGNEPNLAKFWKPKPDPIEFGKTVMAYAKTIRSIAPDVTIMSGGLVGYDIEFAKGMLSTGLGDWVDVIAIHTPRWQPEYARNRHIDHADALARFRKLIEGVNPKLVVWQTEVQAVGGIDRAESGITDYQEARHIARRFLYEHKLGIPVSFWQTLKATPEMEHPGALLRADGTPTIKYCSIRNVASVLDSTLKPSDVPAEIHCHRQSRVSLYKSGPIPVSTRWEGPSVRIQPRQNIELKATVKTDAESVDVRLVWVDAEGKLLEPVEDKRPVMVAVDGMTSVCFRYPAKFRPAGAHAVRVVLATTDVQPLDIHSVEVTACGVSLPGKPRVLTFEREGKLYVSWWLDSRPGPEKILEGCTIRVRCPPGKLANPVYADLIDGTVRTVSVRRDGEWSVLENLPISDYSFILADKSSFRLASESLMADDFTSPEDLTRQYVGDCFGLGRPEYWKRICRVLGENQAPLAKAYRKAAYWFGKRLKPTTVEIEVTDVPVIEYTPRTLDWRASSANPGTKHVDRYFMDLATREAPAQLHLSDGKRELPSTKRWADVPENAGKWFMSSFRGVPRLFIIVPKGQSVPKNYKLTYPLKACQPNLYAFRDPATSGSCLVLWSGTLAELPEFNGDITLDGSADALPVQAVIIDLATGRELCRVKADDEGNRRRLSGIPINSEGIMVVDGISGFWNRDDAGE